MQEGAVSAALKSAFGTVSAKMAELSKEHDAHVDQLKKKEQFNWNELEQGRILGERFWLSVYFIISSN